MEREIPFGFSIYLSESAPTGISDRQCEDHLAFDLEASRCAAFSNLQPAARFLYTAKLGCAGCGHRTGHASHESGDETGSTSSAWSSKCVKQWRRRIRKCMAVASRSTDAVYHFWAVKPRRSGRGYKAGLSESVIRNFFRPQDLWAGSAKVKPLSFSSAEVKRLWGEPSEEIRVKPTRTP